jgi:hypothetical protein
MVRILLITCFVGFSLTVSAQDGRSSKKHIGCYIPPYRPRGDKHENCKYNGGRQGVWNFYSYSGFLLQQIGYKDNKVVWTIAYYADLKNDSIVRKTTGTPPDSILKPKNEKFR